MSRIMTKYWDMRFCIINIYLLFTDSKSRSHRIMASSNLKLISVWKGNFAICFVSYPWLQRRRLKDNWPIKC